MPQPAVSSLDSYASLRTDRWAGLLVAAGHGDEASFEMLAHEARGALRRQALRVLDDAGDADEIVQETLLEAWCRCARYDPARTGTSAWLGQIARQRAIDRVRVASTRRHREARAHTTRGASRTPPNRCSSPPSRTPYGRRCTA